MLTNKVLTRCAQANAGVSSAGLRIAMFNSVRHGLIWRQHGSKTLEGRQHCKYNKTLKTNALPLPEQADHLPIAAVGSRCRPSLLAVPTRPCCSRLVGRWPPVLHLSPHRRRDHHPDHFRHRRRHHHSRQHRHRHHCRHCRHSCRRPRHRPHRHLGPDSYLRSPSRRCAQRQSRRGMLLKATFKALRRRSTVAPEYLRSSQASRHPRAPSGQ